MNTSAFRLSLAFAAVLLVPSIGVAGAPALSEEVPEGLSAADWSGIREAYEAGRHAARPAEGGYLAHNPGQGWSTVFDGRGFTTSPDDGAWSWGLELERYGFAGRERAVERPARVSAEGGRVAYDWGAELEEWYVNDARGLEHGFTVHGRPAGETADGPLMLTLAVRGSLVPEVTADGRGVRFLHEAGAVALTYAGLAVFDADGRSLPARFERVPEGLLLTVDQRHARYPLTIDPIAQKAYLKASNTDVLDLFGSQVAVSGDTVVVAARLEDSNATGVDGDQSDNSAEDSGAAYVFVRTGSSWSQQAYLKASNTAAGDAFAGSSFSTTGCQVSVSGDTIVIGAPGEDSSATGVNGDQSNNGTGNSGAAYVFVRNGTTWTQQAYLKASNTEAGDGFGCSVSVSGDTVVVGAAWEDSSATGVNGDQTNNDAENSGAAYVFVRSGTIWSQQAYLKAFATSNPIVDDFGTAVSVSGDTVLVGASGAIDAAGRAYVFVRSGTSWSQAAYLKGSNTEINDYFGCSVSVSGDTAVVGAWGGTARAAE